MTWHPLSHSPSIGDHIIVKYHGCTKGNYFQVIVREGESLNHIEKWCYYEDYQRAIRRIRDEKND